jgi:hypothetical protein
VHNTTTCPQPHEQLLVGWIAGGTTTTTQHHATMTTTRPQPHEQLLVGWNAGGTTITTTQGNNGTPPTSSLTSNCSWGGSWVEQRQRQRRAQQQPQTTHHPPPAPRATARGVDRGWNNAQSTMEGGQCNERHTTRPSLTSNCSWGGSWVERRGGHHDRRTTTAPTTIATSHCSWGGNGCYVRSTGGHYEHNAPLANVFFFPIRFFFFSNSFICISYVVPLAFVRGVSSRSIYITSKSTYVNR